MTQLQVLIVGAGPTGMTAAIELRRAGLDVRIVDKSDHLARWSQALVIQARTLEQFQRYGIAHTVVERGRPLTGARTFSDSKMIVHFAFDQIQSRYPYLLFLPQSETEAILNEHMESLGVKTERGVELISLQQRPDRVQARLRHPDGREEAVEANWVIGCDGAHSFVREACGIAFQGHGVDLRFFLGDMVVEGDDKPQDELLLHLHHGDVIFTAPLTDKLTRVIVAKHADATGKGSDEPNRQLRIEDFQQALDDAGVKLRILSSEWMTPFHVNDRQAEHYRSGRVFLAGDASHIHSPVGGQGMNTGIQDAANLCWKLAAVERGAGAAEALLNSYETERATVGRALLSRTEAGLKLFTSANPVTAGLRDLLAPHLSETSAVRKAVSGFISETAIEYRSSPVVVDKGGDGELRAGDRLPDATLGGGATLLQHWTSGHPLAVLVDCPEATRAEIVAALPKTEVAALRSDELEDEGRRLFGAEPSLLLLRPDGYIGFRGAPDAKEAWRRYARENAL